MQCGQAPQIFAGYLADELSESEQGELQAHLKGCQGCRAELTDLKETWGLLNRWPEPEPNPAIGPRLRRQIRWLAFREALLSFESWHAALLPAALGVVLSAGLSFLIPYNALVEFCRRAVGELTPEPGPFLMAGLVYGLVPLALATWLAGRRPPGGLFVRGLEAALLFFVLIAPYVIVQCREFSLPALAGFLGGMVLGGFLGSLGVGWRWAGRLAGLSPLRYGDDRND